MHEKMHKNMKKFIKNEIIHDKKCIKHENSWCTKLSCTTANYFYEKNMIKINDIDD